MAEFKSFKNKIVDFGTKAASFKGDDGKTVDYTQVVLTVQLEGSNEEIVLSGVNAPKPKLLQTILRGAEAVNRTPKQDTGAGNFLDDDEA